ncbi:MAG: alpha/beta hydrolase [Pseudomonadota bacterium]
MNELNLPLGVAARCQPSVNGLAVHYLEAGRTDAPVVLLLHGFPDLAYGWRAVMVPLAAAGFRVLAPDLRGYGRTTGWSTSYDNDLRPFGFMNLVRDLLAFLDALDVSRLHLCVGHDFGSPLAAYFALLRGDRLERLVLSSAPFGGAPATEMRRSTLDAALASLPQPRRHYQDYFAGRNANGELLAAPQGLTRFLRGYFHVKSADWAENQPQALEGWDARQLARLPRYYVMDRDQTMAATVAPWADVPEPAWLTEAELAVYANEYARTGFQGGLNWYRAMAEPALTAELSVLYRKPIATPTWFISGASDWGNHQTPGALRRMETRVCTDYRGTRLIPRAGHWLQQEQPAALVHELLDVCAQ